MDRFVPTHRTVIRSEGQIKFTSLDGSLVCRVELISVTMPCDDNLVLPVREEERNALEEDWLVEKGTVQAVPQCCIWRAPQLFESEFSLSEGCWGDCGTFHTYLVYFDGFESIVCDFIIVIVTALDRKIKGLQLDIDVRQNQLQHAYLDSLHLYH